MKTKHVVFNGFMVMALIVSAIYVQADILGPVNVKDRLGNGWHMQTETYVSDNGLVSGITKVTNYNNAFGFTGGLFVVVLDSQMRPIYTSPMHKWGINAAGFSKKRERNATWTEQIPSVILEDAATIAVI